MSAKPKPIHPPSKNQAKGDLPLPVIRWSEDVREKYCRLVDLEWSGEASWEDMVELRGLRRLSETGGEGC